jgi:predicted DsbA family dithiol-disulfide isomerase
VTEQTDPLHFYFDFVDPGSYLVHELLERRLEDPNADAGIGVEWIPLELRPPPTSLLAADDPGWQQMTRTLAREARDLDLPFSPPTLIPWTRKAHELALHAMEVKGRVSRIHSRLFRAHFEKGLDLGRVDVLIALADEVGLDPAEARTVLGVDRFEPAVREARERAARLEIRGVPTLVRRDLRLEGFSGADEVATFLKAAT